jgi:hypothetical protein
MSQENIFHTTVSRTGQRLNLLTWPFIGKLLRSTFWWYNLFFNSTIFGGNPFSEFFSKNLGPQDFHTLGSMRWRGKSFDFKLISKAQDCAKALYLCVLSLRHTLSVSPSGFWQDKHKDLNFCSEVIGKFYMTMIYVYVFKILKSSKW